MLIRSILGGILISLGCIAYLSSDDKFIGSLLFSIGLLTIIYFKYYLYTGAICTFKYNDEELPLITIGNIIGTTIVSLFVKYSRLNYLIPKIDDIVLNKSNDSFLSLFIMGMLCELCIFIAVTAKEYKPLFIIFGVTVFVFCGFEHCIADSFYLITSNLFEFKFIIPVFLGNTISGVILKNIK